MAALHLYHGRLPPHMLSLQGGWAVSPAELREALGALSGGGFGLSDMHDAAEVLGELLACLHRCDFRVWSAAGCPCLLSAYEPQGVAHF
jgi:hypothetical protein